LYVDILSCYFVESVYQTCRGKGTLIHAGGNVNVPSQYGNQCDVPQNIKYKTSI
jgi:hypothetical protein